MKPNAITISTIIHAPLSTVWDAWTKPAHITHWAFASADWEAPHAENDVRVGGRFLTRMAAKDKSAGFDFTGTYTVVKEHELIEYAMDKAPHESESRQVMISFTEAQGGVKVTETFDPENQNPAEMQRAGWQAILNNFKKYAESQKIL
jgi:uncharacterized protein YndB with AHSA1/START domain